MDKLGSENIPCTFCDETAMAGTNPPVCRKHLEESLCKKATEEVVDTVKKLDAADIH